MKYENVEQLAARLLSLQDGQCEKIDNGDEELNLWVSFEKGEYTIDWEAWSSLENILYNYGLAKVSTALEAAHQVAKIVN